MIRLKETLFCFPRLHFVSRQGCLLPIFPTTKDATVTPSALEFKEAVTEHKWRDEDTKIKSRVGSWRACFPAAEATNVSGDHYLHGKVTNKDFRRLKSLNMSWCRLVISKASKRAIFGTAPSPPSRSPRLCISGASAGLFVDSPREGGLGRTTKI